MPHLERSFSALKRVKTYIRTNMTQGRLNDLMILHVHKERVNRLDLGKIAEDYFCGTENTLRKFGSFLRVA